MRYCQILPLWGAIQGDSEMKILYVATISDTINAFLVPHIEMLVEKGNSVDVACCVRKPLNQKLTEIGCKIYNLPFSRSPLKSSNLKAAMRLRSIIRAHHYDIVHTHTPNASVCSRLASRKSRKQGLKVIYTAHGFHFFAGAPLKNWLLYYPAERFLSRYTDVLITINKEDYERAVKSFKAKKTVYIPGVGIDVKRAGKEVIGKKEKRLALDIPEHDFVLLSVGELNSNKNHKTVIKALGVLKNPGITYIICGDGDQKADLAALISGLGLNGKVRLLGYRNDVPEICRAADLFLHPSYREGLSVSLMEAMTAGLPCIVSGVRGNTDLIEDQKGGYTCRPDDIGGFAAAVARLQSDRRLSELMGQYNKEAIKRFDIGTVLAEIGRIYEN